MHRRSGGLSLIELLLVVTLLCLLLSRLDLAGMSRSREARLVDAAMSDLVSAISMARSAAIMESVMVTWCRSDDGGHCQGAWHEGSIIFTDHNADRVINGDDRLLYRLGPALAAGRIRFNSFRNRQYLQLTPFGITNYQNGNFTYCPNDRDPTLARQVIVSITGRTRYAKDSDGDGVVEDSQGRPVECN